VLVKVVTEFHLPLMVLVDFMVVVVLVMAGIVLVEE
jgi:hypothetical protein